MALLLVHSLLRNKLLGKCHCKVVLFIDGNMRHNNIAYDAFNEISSQYSILHYYNSFV